MYADKTAAGCTVAGSCLAITGVDFTQSLFFLLAAAVLIISGYTLIRLFGASPKTIETGPVPSSSKRWSIKKKY